jgi:hypothetical protein
MNFKLPNNELPFCFFGITSIARKGIDNNWIIEIKIPTNHPDLNLKKEYFFKKYQFNYLHSTSGYVHSSEDANEVKEIIIQLSKQLHQNKIPSLRTLALRTYINEWKLYLQNQANISIDEILQFCK